MHKLHLKYLKKSVAAVLFSFIDFLIHTAGKVRFVA